MKSTRDDILNSNDSMTDFIDSKLIITNDGDDHISKGEMLKIYKTFNDKSLITINQIIVSLKQSSTNIQYNTNIRNKDGTRSAFLGVKFAPTALKKYDDDDEDVTAEEYTKMKNKLENHNNKIKYLIKLLVKNIIKIKDNELTVYIERENNFWNWNRKRSKIK